MFELDWRVWASLALVLIILYMLIIPNKAKRAEYFEQQKRQKRHADRVQARPKTYPLIQVTSLTARRGDTVTVVTMDGQNNLIAFGGIAEGHYSETVFLVVTGEGEIKQFPNEVLAQNAYQKGDYGILAVTMAPGIIGQRSIVPEVIHPDNAYTMEFSARVSAK